MAIKKISRKSEFSQKQNAKPPVPTTPAPAHPTPEKKSEEEFEQTKAIEVRGFAKPLVTVEEAVGAFNQYQKLTQALMKSSDIVEIVMRGKPKTLIKKSGLNKVAKFFGISVEIVRVQKEEFVGPQGGRGTIWKVWAKAIAPNGQFRVAGAACSSRERMFAHPDHDIMATAETRAKKRAIEELAGMGEYDLAEDYEADVEQEAAPAQKTQPRAKQSDKTTSLEEGAGRATAKQIKLIYALVSRLAELGYNWAFENLPEEMNIGEAAKVIKEMMDKGKALKEELEGGAQSDQIPESDLV